MRGSFAPLVAQRLYCRGSHRTDGLRIAGRLQIGDHRRGVHTVEPCAGDGKMEKPL
ncbi:hypothetical protein SDC9_205072 [bioreactor metagenome]|uniref:Uncharacterized protein n=1 Tax=bioreactor metagenome TaxID=1076179 RepID=A0A645J117_9ZZZZ